MEYGLVLVWLTALAVLAALATPLAARLFPRWPTAGLGFALPVALLALGVTAFWVGRVAYGYPSLLAGLVVLAAVSGLVGLDRDRVRDRVRASTGGESDGTDPRALLAAVAAGLPVDRSRLRRTALSEVVAVFLLSFGFMTAVRAADPAVYALAGEKFLDFGLLQALDRADTLPPEDFWFAGEGLRYYYGGHLVSHLLGLLTGTAPRYVYNLAMATFFATYVTAAFDLAGAVAAARGYGRRSAAWAAAFVVGLAGNAVTGSRLAVRALPDAVQSAVLGVFQPYTDTNLAQSVGTELGPFNRYWQSSRVIDGTINEFPLFGFLNGDLHAHMMGPTFLLLAAALAFALYRTGADETTRRRALLFCGVPVVGAFQAVVHTWAFPTVFGLAWLGLALSPTPPRTLLPEAVRAPLDRLLGARGSGTETGVAADGGDGGRTMSSGTTAPSGATGAAGATAASGATGTPGFESLRSELARPVVAAALVGGAGVLAALLAAPFLLAATGSGSEREVALWAAGKRSGLGALLLVHWVFVVPFVGYLFDRLGDERPGELVLAGVVLAVVGGWLSLPALVLVGPLLLGGWIAGRVGRGGFETALIVGGAGLVVLVEVVYLNEQAGPGRMNTVFKTYSQVWAIWAPAAGVTLAALVRRVETPQVWPSAGARRAVAVVLVVLALGAVAGYPAQTVPDHFTVGDPEREPSRAISFDYPTEPTLDATAHVARFRPGVAVGLEYFADVPGTPVLLSAPGTSWYPDRGFDNPPGAYSWQSNPVASLSGVPTVAGWDHEVGYRGLTTYRSRVRDVDAAYTDRTATVATIRAYDVSYVWVGPPERRRYGTDLVAFDSISGVERVVAEEGVVLYRVDRSELPDADG